MGTVGSAVRELFINRGYAVSRGPGGYYYCTCRGNSLVLVVVEDGREKYAFSELEKVFFSVREKERLPVLFVLDGVLSEDPAKEARETRGMYVWDIFRLQWEVGRYHLGGSCPQGEEWLREDVSLKPSGATHEIEGRGKIRRNSGVLDDGASLPESRENLIYRSPGVNEKKRKDVISPSEAYHRLEEGSVTPTYGFTSRSFSIGRRSVASYTDVNRRPPSDDVLNEAFARSAEKYRRRHASSECHGWTRRGKTENESGSGGNGYENYERISYSKRNYAHAGVRGPPVGYARGLGEEGGLGSEGSPEGFTDNTSSLFEKYGVRRNSEWRSSREPSEERYFPSRTLKHEASAPSGLDRHYSQDLDNSVSEDVSSILRSIPLSKYPMYSLPDGEEIFLFPKVRVQDAVALLPRPVYLDRTKVFLLLRPYYLAEVLFGDLGNEHFREMIPLVVLADGVDGVVDEVTGADGVYYSNREEPLLPLPRFLEKNDFISSLEPFVPVEVGIRQEETIKSWGDIRESVSEFLADMFSKFVLLKKESADLTVTEGAGRDMFEMIDVVHKVVYLPVWEILEGEKRTLVDGLSASILVLRGMDKRSKDRPVVL